MEFLGKRTDRMRVPRQLGMDPEMGAIIRSRADKKFRSFEAQLIWLITVGIENDPEFSSNERRRGELHAPAQRSISEKREQVEEHFPAQPRKALHTDARKNGTNGDAR